MLATMEDRPERAEVDSALAMGLSYLTLTERRIIGALMPVGRWFHHERVQLALYGLAGKAEAHACHAHISRTRAKLRGHAAPVDIETQPGSIRLVESETEHARRNRECAERLERQLAERGL